MFEPWTTHTWRQHIGTSSLKATHLQLNISNTMQSDSIYYITYCRVPSTAVELNAVLSRLRFLVWPCLYGALL